MRDTKTQNLLKLIPWLQGNRTGVSQREIQERFGASARTVRRWIAELQSAFPYEMEWSDLDGSGRKRWRLRTPSDGSYFASISPEDVSALETAVSLFERDDRSDLAQGLRSIRNLVNAYVEEAKNRPAGFHNDVNDLVEAEGLVMRPGPRFQLDPKIMSALRDAIQRYERVRIRYGNADRIVEPYGFLYGKKHYLVAFLARKREETPRLLILSNIHDVESLGETFVHRKGFDLRAYANQSFGAFQGDTVTVEWKFSPKVAEEARKYVFHPTQKVTTQDDGSVVVIFRASGQLEMAHHLLGWGDKVEVIRPKKLKELVVQLAAGGLQRCVNSESNRKEK